MPRQDVPYGGAICRLRERIAEIWDELGKKLHSINGVEGDGQGNVQIVSGDPAVVITDDQLQHEIEISLDTSQLPAAAVSSVNGQTGAVALTADDIPSDNGDVQTDIDNLEAADTTLQGNINAEALARANADSTLQTNINAALATIPGEVTSQIAANATIAQLVYEDGQNVKVTGNQTVNGIKLVDTQATGSYSAQIANSDKVKNELDNYTPMVRTTGNQNNIAGTKGFLDLLCNPHQIRITNTYYDWFTFPVGGNNTYSGTACIRNRNGLSFFNFTITTDANAEISGVNIVNAHINSGTTVDYLGAYTKDGYAHVIIHANGTNRYYSPQIMALFFGNGFIRTIQFSNEVVASVEADYAEVLMP